MKKLLGLVGVLVILGAGIWWFTRKTAESAIPGKVIQSPPTPKPQTVTQAPIEAPKLVRTAAAAPVRPEPVKTAPIDSTEAYQAEVKATVSHLIGMLETNDLVGYNTQRMLAPAELEGNYQRLVESFAKINQAHEPGQPDLKIPTLAEYKVTVQGTIQSQPLRTEMPAEFKTVLTNLKAVENATPKINEAGDEAEYDLNQASPTAVPGMPKILKFHKENGQWYEGPKPVP